VVKQILELLFSKQKNSWVFHCHGKVTKSLISRQSWRFSSLHDGNVTADYINWQTGGCQVTSNPEVAKQRVMSMTHAALRSKQICESDVKKSDMVPSYGLQNSCFSKAVNSCQFEN